MCRPIATAPRGLQSVRRPTLPAIARLVLPVLLLAPPAGAAQRIDLVSNEGQAADQGVDRVFLVTNAAAPAAPTTPPPPNDDGTTWTASGYATVDAGWRAALPAWRAAHWPTTGLPTDAGGALKADWIWSSPLDADVVPALLFPDHGNGTQFPRRLGGDGTFDHGFVPAMLDAAAFVRRELALPLNTTVAGGPLTLLADGDARATINGAAVVDGDTVSLLPGRNVLAFEAWSRTPGAVVGGLLWHAAVTYEVAAVNGTLEAPVVAADALVVPIRVDAAWPAGTRLSVVGEGFANSVTLPALGSGGTNAAVSLVGAGPGDLLHVTLDAADSLGRPAGGAENLLGGTAGGAGVLGAIGAVEETDEGDNEQRVRLAPKIDASFDGIAVATETLVVFGLSAPGTTVRLVRGDEVLVEGVADAAGRFALTVVLARGRNELVAVAAGAGVESAPSPQVTIACEDAAPGAPVITRPADGALMDAAPDTVRIEVAGTGLVGAHVEVVAGPVSCEAAVDPAGEWQCPLELAIGDHLVTARHRSAAGLLSAPASVRVVVVASETPDAGPDPVDAGEEPVDVDAPYATRGGGGCDSASASVLALAGLALLFRRRRALPFLAVLFVAGTARAQLAAPFEATSFRGPSPLVPAAAPRSGGTPFGGFLSAEWVRDPIVLVDPRTGLRAGALVGDRLDLRLTGTFVAQPWLAFAASVPAVPWQRGDGFGAGAPVVGAAFGDVSASALVGIVRTTPFSLGLHAQLSAPTGTGTFAGSGAFSGGALLAAGGELGALSWGAAIGARLPRGGLEPAFATVGNAAQLDARAGVAWTFGPVSPFVEVAGLSPFDGGLFSAAASPVLASGGVRARFGPVDVSVSGGRGVTSAPGAPAARAAVQIGLDSSFFDPRGNAGAKSSGPVAVEVDAPTFLQPAEGEFMWELRPLVAGLAEPDALVTVWVDGVPLAPVRADADGRFRLELPHDLEIGVHHVVAAQQAALGDSDRSAPRGFLVEPPIQLNPEDDRRRTIATIVHFVESTGKLRARVTPEGVSITTDVYFAFDEDRLRPEETWKLAELSRILRAFPSLAARIESHTDDVGTPEYNLALSRRRAASVAHFLADQHGVGAQRLVAEGFGDSRPVTTNATPEGRAKNRRFADCILLVP